MAVAPGWLPWDLFFWEWGGVAVDSEEVIQLIFRRVQKKLHVYILWSFTISHIFDVYYIYIYYMIQITYGIYGFYACHANDITMHTMVLWHVAILCIQMIFEMRISTRILAFPALTLLDK